MLVALRCAHFSSAHGGESPIEARILQLLEFICLRLSEQRVIANITRLTKLLYLADLYTARRSENSETLTGWEWQFGNFGPWSESVKSSIESAISRGLIAKNKLPYKDSVCTYELVGRHNSEFNAIPLAIRNQIDDKIRELSEFGTGHVLNHVYFDTEPMMHATPGETIDFRKVVKDLKAVDSAKVVIVELGSQKIAEAQLLLSKMRQVKTVKRTDEPRFDDVYYAGCSSFDDSEPVDFRAEGQADVSDLLRPKG